MRARRLLLAALVGLLPGHAPAQAPPHSIAVLDFEIIDDTRPYNSAATNAAQDARLRLISDELRKALAQRGLYRVADNARAAPLIASLAAGQPLHACNGCEADIARALGADRVMVCWVQKVSNLILNINVEVHDAASGGVLYGRSVDIRGNTDASWTRGVRYMVDEIAEAGQNLR